jgi:hypothetical protein
MYPIFEKCLESQGRYQSAYQEVTNLSIVATRVQYLLNEPRGSALATTAALRSLLENSYTQLEQLQAKLKPSIFRKTIRRFGFRALKWPFNSKDAEKVVQDVMRHTQAISIALQIDQA